MNIDPYILAFSALTVIATIWMGFRSAKRSKTASDFFVAGRSVSVGWNASAISGEYLSAASFMGIAGMVMSSGYDALWYPVCYACGYLFLLLFIAGPLRRFGAYTIPDFAEGRFDSPMFRKIAVVFVLFIGFFYTMPQMKGAGTTLAYIFQDVDLRGGWFEFLAPRGATGQAIKGFPYWAGVMVVGAVITLNVALGGMKGITLVQAFQYWAKMFAISVPIFVLMAVYGHYGKQVEVNGDPTPLAVVEISSVTNRIQFVKIVPHPGAIGLVRTHRQLMERLGWFGRIKADVRQFFRRLGSSSAPDDDYQLGHACKMLGAGTSNTVLSSTTCDLKVQLTGKRISEWRDNADLIQQTAAVVRDSGFTLFIANSGEFIVCKNSEAGMFARSVSPASRVTLPAKAPADSTWLNPFGPLTTKAAKNAAAAIGKKVAREGAKEATDSDTAIAWAEVTPSRYMHEPLWARVAQKVLPAQTLNPFPSRVQPVWWWAANCAALTGDRYYLSPELTNNAGAVFGHSTNLSGWEYVAQVHAALTNHGAITHVLTNGTKLIVNGQSVWQTNPIVILREPGVVRLTTQAGRAVPSAPDRGVESNGKVAVAARRGEDTAPYRASTIPLRAGLSPDQRMTVNLESPTVSQALGVYADLTGRLLVPNTNSIAERIDDLLGGKLSQFKLISRLAMPDSGVREHGDGVFTAAEVKAAIEAHLWTNGLALVPAGERGLRLVAADVGRLQSKAAAESNQRSLTSAATSAERAWLAKHEKPLALLYTYSLIIAIVCGTAGLPHILVRFYTNPDGTAAKKTTMWVMILIGVFYVFPPVFGVIGRNLLPELYAGVGAKGTDKIVLELPRILNAKYPPLGSILSGVTCAGAFAAFMSTFSGLLVSMTGALAHDVYGRILKPKSTSGERMKMFKIGAVILGGVAIVLGSFVEKLEINFMVGQAFAIAASSYFPLLFMAVWWRKLTMKGAASGMLGGGILAVIAISLTSFSTLAAGTDKTAQMFSLFKPLNAFWAEHPLARILCEQPAIWAVPLAIMLMIVVSKLTAREVPGDIRMKMLVLHAPEELGLKQEYIQEHQAH